MGKHPYISISFRATNEIVQRLTGEFEVKVDAKGRFRLPTQLIRQLGEEAHRFVINRGFEQCLTIYPQSVWDKITAELDKLNIYNRKKRNFVRHFYRGANELTLDGSDRLLLPKQLMEHADLSKEIVLFAYKDRIEVWAKDKYQQMIDEEFDDFSDLAEDVMGNIE